MVKFEDLSITTLKQIIRNYRMHLLFDIKDYTKKSREELVELCNNMFNINDKEITLKAHKPMTFILPEKKLKKEKKKPKKKVIEEKEQKLIKDYEFLHNENSKAIKSFDAMTNQQKNNYIKAHFVTIDESKLYDFDTLNYFKEYILRKNKETYHSLWMESNPKYNNYNNVNVYINSMLKNEPMKHNKIVIEANKARQYKKKEDMLRPIKQLLNDRYEKYYPQLRMYSKAIDSILHRQNQIMQ
jgi:hypothetical protein